MQVSLYLGTRSQTLELVQPGEDTFDDPADLAETGTMCGPRRAIIGVIPFLRRRLRYLA